MNVSDLAATPFRWASAIRHRRIFHPDGVLAEGSIERLAPANGGLPIPSSDVVARVSKAVGTPGALPDIIGLALRLTPQDSESPWDILLASAGSGVLGRTVGLRPVMSWTGQTLTSLMPLRYRQNYWWLRARVLSKINGSGVSLDSVRNQLDNGGIEFALDQARGRSSFRQLGRVRLTKIIVPSQGEDVSFDPVLHTAPGVQLYPGWLAGLRGSAYDRSREGRNAD
ncbi:MAG: phosphodiesterase [Mycobacterium sp.]|nr:phosphodiesterase [Mycobacterium sp.]